MRWHFKFCVEALSLVSWRLRSTRNALLDQSGGPSSPVVCVKALLSQSQLSVVNPLFWVWVTFPKMCVPTFICTEVIVV